MRKIMKHTNKLVFAIMGVGVLCSYFDVQDIHAQSHGYTNHDKYPGIMCQSVGGTNNGPIIYWPDRVFNGNNSRDMYVVCPIPMIENNEKVEWVLVDVNDRSTSKDITCTLNLMNSNGNNIFSKRGSSRLGQGIYLGPLSYTGTAKYGSLFCKLPSREGSSSFGVYSYSLFKR